MASILNSQAHPPTFRNFGFMIAGTRFSKNQGLGSKDALGGVLGLSWARFGCSWELLGVSFGAFAASRWHLACSKLLLRLLSWPKLCFFLVSASAPFCEVIVFLLLEPLRVEFELSS